MYLSVILLALTAIVIDIDCRSVEYNSPSAERSTVENANSTYSTFLEGAWNMIKTIFTTVVVILIRIPATVAHP